ncbi:MAG: NADH-quinone oxidoreductase subunit N [Chloroflexi bacterium]|nr:NADH-quinone oxidoreductase subunit N [Chloroflexota bacterium]
MTIQDLYLLSPEVALVALALAIVLLDLVITEKRILAVVVALGLLVPAALAVVLWGDVQACENGTLGGDLADSCIDGRLSAIFGTLAVDRFALFFKFLVLAIVFVLILGSADYVRRFHQFQGEFYALVLFSASGMMLLPATTELISIYISLELTVLPLVALSTFVRDARSSEAGMKFLILSAISSAMLLYGMTLVLAFTGSTELSVIATAVTEDGVPFGSYALFLGIVLIVAGFGFKISMVPFQMWAPDVYEGAPTPVTAYLSVASKAVGFAVILRVFYIAFGELDVDWGVLFAVLSVLSMVVGNLVAIAQNNIKRMLAYSTVAQAGYILIGVAAIAARVPDQETLGPSSVLFYLVAYAATNLAAFFAIIVITNKTGSDDIDSFAGMGRRAPVVAAILAFAMLSLIGIPPTAGFMGKLYIFSAAIRSDLVWLAVAGVVNSALSAYYYLRVIRTMYLMPAESEERAPSSAPMRLALGLTGLGILVVGLVPGPLIEIAESSAAVLLPGV